ncbi:hypothetical protein MSG28_002927 [Choristoneura fumiferana]|uniref:Uncharacterized protein n=1 Tax=Choristoneura fumiferana TaxID=7141 RepID=A0ACC0JJW4_CHOFU|nr:hypothetical protein MSG28_002927 [Choristoneura fumiferana]
MLASLHRTWGEWNIAAGWLLGGNMFEMARENHGYQVYTEHRYYGETVPYANFTTENLRFLNVDQALADLAYFIQAMKQQPRFADSPVILYGGSYAANMVLWFKQRYPHLVLGTVASSGPIKGQVDFTGYLETVHEAFLSEGGEQCIDVIRQGNTPMEKIGGYIAQTAGLTTCWDMRYEALINTYSQPRSNSRAWYFQTCTEYGFFQTAPRIGTVFDPLVWLTVDFYVDICKKAFSERFDEEFVYDAVERVNLAFGGLEPDVNNTINIHGDIDPWHYLGGIALL